MSERYHVGSVVFGNWVLEREIGAGGYGVVYEARREEFGEVYKSAIKIMTVPQDRNEVVRVRSEGMDEASVSTHFREIAESLASEVALMSRFKGHSNVVSYEDHMVIKHDDGIGWDILIRMELLTPLTKYLCTSQFRRSDVIRLGIGICNALELCQMQNVIHRDVKQDNIFVSDQGDFKLGDFGIARIMEHTNCFTPNQGTEMYMAPEVRKGEIYGPTVDIYSLGIVLYRLLNDNRMPFLPEYPQQISYSDRQRAEAMRISGETIPAPRNADGKLAQIVMKACAYRPEDRYASPAAMRAELESLLNEQDVMVTPHTTEKKKGRKNKIGLIALILLLLVASGLALRFFGKTETNVKVDLPELVMIGTGYDVPIPYEVLPETESVEQLHWKSGDEEILHVISATLIGRKTGETWVELEYQNETDSCRVLVLDNSLDGNLLELKTCDWYYAPVSGNDFVDALFLIDGEIYLYSTAHSYDEEIVNTLMWAAQQELSGFAQEKSSGWLNVWKDETYKDELGSVVLTENTSGEPFIVIHKGKQTYILGISDVTNPAEITAALELNAAELTLATGEEYVLEAKGIQSDGSVADLEGLEWSTSDKHVCKVKNGKVTAVAEGVAEITVTNGEVAAVCVVTVEDEETEPEETKKASGNNSASSQSSTDGSSSSSSSSSGSSGSTSGSSGSSSGSSGSTSGSSGSSSGSSGNTSGSSGNTSGSSGSTSGSSGSSSGSSDSTKPTAAEPATEPAETEPVTEPETETPTEPQGKAPAGYSISLSASSVNLYQTFTVQVIPDVIDYTQIVVHAIDPTGGRWDFTLSGKNSTSLYVDDASLVGTWKLYADVYNEYGTYYGSSSGPFVTIRVTG